MSVVIKTLADRIHRANTLVPESSAFEIEMAVVKLQRHKAQSTDQIPAELIRADGRIIRFEIHKLIKCIWN